MKSDFGKLVEEGREKRDELADQKKNQNGAPPSSKQSRRDRRARSLNTLPAMRSLTFATDLLLVGAPLALGLAVASVLVGGESPEAQAEAELVTVALGAASVLCVLCISRMAWVRRRHRAFIAASPFPILDYELTLDSRNMFRSDEVVFEILFAEQQPAADDLSAALELVMGGCRWQLSSVSRGYKIEVTHKRRERSLRGIETNMDLNGQRRWVPRWLGKVHGQVLTALHAEYPIAALRFLSR